MPRPPPAGTATAPAPASAPSAFTRWLALAVGLALVVAVLRFVLLDIEPARDTLRDLNSKWLVPLLIAAIILVGLAGGARVYQAFISAAKEGFTTVVSIIPFLVGMLVAIGLFRASGALEAVVSVVGPVTGLIGFPPEALPMALLRPFSGSGSLGVLGDVLKTHGPDSFLGYLVSVMNGSTETTFYVLALYGGAAGIKDLRHTVIACVTGDVVGPVAALVLCRLFFS